MRLNLTNLLPYLLGRSWLNPDAAVLGDAVVIERRLRHTSFVVEQRSGGVFVKQLHDPHPDAAASLRREATFYKSIAAGHLAELAAFVPAFVGYDEHEHVLALARFDGVSAQDRAVAGQPLNASESAALGRALATTHRVSAAAARTAAPEALDDSLPWAFHLSHHLTSSPAQVPGAGLAMLDVLHGHPGLVEWLGQLASWWRRETLIHGDLKWENVLLASNHASAGNQGDVRLIDWELSASGDPAWDVATLLQATLVRTCLVQAQSRALEWPDLSPHHDALQAFVRAWAMASGRHDFSQEYQRILGFAATRLVYTAYEHATVSSEIHPAILAMVTTAWRMLRDGRYAAGLLGFGS